MTKKLKNIIKVVVTLTALAMPALALAAGEVENGLRGLGSSGIFPRTGVAGATTVTQLIGFIIGWLLFLAGAIAVLFVIIGGYWYITSGGNEETAEKGRKTLINAIIGVIVVVLSYVIINVVVNLVSGTGGFLNFGF